MTNEPGPSPYKIEVFFDGGCGVCRREVKLLHRLDRRREIRFVDIDAPTFDAAAVGKTREALMARIHGRLPDGTWLEGVEVFRRMYSIVGLGPLVAVTRLPLISQLLDWGYALFARYRRRSGQCASGT